MMGQVETEEPNVLKIEEPQEQTLPKKKSFSTRSKVVIFFSLSSLFGLVAIFLSWPSVVGCGNRAKSSEGKTYVGSMNRGQQAFWVENQTFGTSIPALNLGVKTETTNYKYDLQSFEMVSYQYAVPKVDEAKSFVGAVFLVSENENKQSSQNTEPKQNATKELTTVPIVCESQEKGVKRKLLKPILQNGKPICAEGVAQ
jgi:hypothetical protein